VELTRLSAAEWLSTTEASVAPLVLLEGVELVAANPAACWELSRQPAELAGRGLLGQFDAESQARFAAAVAAADTRPAFTVTRSTDRPTASTFEIRLQAPVAGQISALIIDVSETYRLDATIGCLADATTALDEEGRMAWRPFGNSQRFGVADTEAVGVRVLEWIHPDELPRVLDLFNQVKSEEGRRVQGIVRMRHPYIRDGWMNSMLTAVNHLHDPLLRGVIVRSEEVTAIDIVEDIGMTAGQYTSIAEAMPIGVIVTDADGAVVFRNELARELLGVDHDVMGRTDWLAALSTGRADELEQLLVRARTEKAPVTTLASVEREPAEASRRWLRIDAVPQIDESENVFGLIATLLDVTNETEARRQLADAQGSLWHLATHDSLTNLPNRVLILDRIEAALKQSAAGGRAVALLYCDLDGFKPINDAHGHTVGDEVLQQVASRLSAQVRERDVVGRFGGDEFLVLCDGFEDASEVEGLVNRLTAAVGKPIVVAEREVTVGVTIGVAYATGTTKVDELITEADDSMYAGKAARVAGPDRRRH
jgi:diguanylate cyclase (GGDEF)-like protein/PAS domain S-box-containing protein